MPVAIKPTLKLGDEGIHVSDLQSMLWMLGYLETEQLTSVFDFPTEHAVKSFQSDWNLRIDGIVGEQTWAALEAAVGGELPPGKNLWDWVREHKVLSFLMLGGIGLCIYLAVKK
ncbi:hypothetical protein ES703_84153 [subsurface metagenome]